MNGNAQAITHRVWLVLKYTYGIAVLVAGADKFIGFITNWSQYVSPIIANLLPLSLKHMLFGVGIIEIIVGLMILTKWTRLGAYIASVWLVVIALNLVSMGMFFDIAVRDVVMAVGAYALAELSRIHER